MVRILLPLLMLCSACADEPEPQTQIWPEVVRERTLDLQGHTAPVAERYLEHQTGNGFIQLISRGDTLLETYAIDAHEDGALPDDMSAKLKPSRFGGPGDWRLDASYSDLNGDGADDLTLRGIVQIGWEDRIVREEPCVLRFIWRPRDGAFREERRQRVGCSVYEDQYDRTSWR